ncbi:hypothetical protein ACLOAV_001494 [Pseudogymnoascus australis]
MVGTQKWSMEEILWVITMVRQGLKDEEIYDKFCGIFKNARHVRGASSIKYCRTGFMKQEDPSDRYSQEKYWEDSPGKIGFVLGRHDSGVYNGQIVADVMHHFPAHTWPSHIKPLARCIEFVITKYRKLQNRQVKFSDYTRDNPLVEPVLRLTEDEVSPEKILETANENGINLDDIYYIMARFGMKVNPRPTAWDLNYGLYSGAGASTSQAGPSNVKPGPLIFQLPPTDSHKTSKSHEPQHSSHRSSSGTGSSLSHHHHGYDYINREGNQVAYHEVQRDLGASLLNSGYPQGISTRPSSQAQQHYIHRRSQPDLIQPLQQHDTRSSYASIPQGGQPRHPMAQQRFEQRNITGYTGDYQDPTIQPTLPSQFHQQNWGHASTFGGQQRVPEQPQNGFWGYQQTPDLLGQQTYGSSSQTGLGSYQPQPGNHLRQAFDQFPQEFLAREQQQPFLPITGYENIDPSLLRMNMEQLALSGTGIMTLSQPPLTPRIAPQDFLHLFAYSGIQNGQDISPLTIENPQFPVILPPSPEVAHDGFENRGQSTIPDPFVQRSVLTEQSRLRLGTDLHHSSGTNGFLQHIFDQALTLLSDTNATNLGHENSRESIQSVLDIPDQGDDQKLNAEGSIAEQAGHTTFEETAANTSITYQEPLSDAKSSLEAMEVVSKALETEMAGPFLTQSLSEGRNDSGGVQCSNSGVFNDDWAPEGTCCARHQDFECFFEVPGLDSESITVLKR